MNLYVLPQTTAPFARRSVIRSWLVFAVVLATASLKADDDFEARMEKPVIGVNVLDVSQKHDQLEEMDIDVPTRIGVLLWRVHSFGPAFKAGMRPLDIILRIDRTLIRSADDYDEAVSRMTPGTDHRVTVYQSVKPDGSGPWKKKTMKVTPVIRRDFYLSSLREQVDEIRGTKIYRHLDSHPVCRCRLAVRPLLCNSGR